MKIIQKLINYIKSRKLALCCKCFPLPYDLECFKDNYKNWVNFDLQSEYSLLKDIWLVYPMLIFLNKTKKSPNGHISYYYKCKHLINNRCSIHENKPDVCRRYTEFNCKKEHLNCKSGCFKESELEEIDYTKLPDGGYKSL
jgi:Fe-S-cluster containining protein